MNLIQYEQFFAKHFDAEVRSRGIFLIKLIDQLQLELTIHSGWLTHPTFQDGTRMDESRLRTILYAIDRHGGNKSHAAKWLGTSREAVHRTLRKWNKVKFKSYENTVLDSNNHITLDTNGLPVPSSITRKQTGRTDNAERLSAGSQRLP